MLVRAYIIGIHETYLKFTGVSITSNEPMWTFDVNYVTHNNSYVQLLVTLCVFQPLLRDLRQTFTKSFVKPAVVRDFLGSKMSPYNRPGAKWSP